MKVIGKHEPIGLHPENPHYFLFRGKAAVLITSAEHYGAVINLDFDYVPYLDCLAAHRLNYTRIYPGALIEKDGDFIPENTLAPRSGRLILPWARSSKPGFALGGNKFDLDTWDEQYFARLRDFIAKAADREIAVEICFFNCQYEKNWALQALYHANNIQGEGTCDHVGFQTLKDKALVARQEAYVAKIAREVNPYDNVILEICDEPGLFGTPAEEYHAWISRLIDVVAETEADLPNKHLIAQQMEGELDGPGDFSADERVSAIVGQYVWMASAKQIGGTRLLETEYSDHQKVIEMNESAYYPVWYVQDREAASRVEAWEFIVGGGAGYNHLNGMFTVTNPTGADRNGNNGRVLDAFMNLRNFIEGFDFVRMRRDTTTVVGGVPTDAFAQCLCEPGRQYAFYIHHSFLRSAMYVVHPGSHQDNLVFDLPPAHYEVEWVNPELGTVVAREEFRHYGGKVTLPTPPYSIDLASRITGQPLGRP
jgi:hypothetical protein